MSPSGAASHRSPRHLLLLTPGFPADEDDDSCIPPLQVLLRHLRATRPELTITVVSLHYPHAHRARRWHDLAVHDLGGRGRRWPGRLVTLAQADRAVRAVHGRDAVDVLHALWLTDAALVGQWTSRRLGLPLVATAMGQDVRPDNRYLRLLRRRWMTVTAVSERASLALAASSGRAADRVIPWGVEPPAGPLPTWSERSVDLLGVGSLTANKDFATWLETVAEVARRRPDCRAVLVGDGPERPRIEHEVTRRGLRDQVALTGHLPRRLVLAHMAASRVLLHPARYEGYGYVLAEALAHGASVVCRPVGGAASGPRLHLVEGDAGWADACCRLLDQPRDTSPLVLHDLAASAAAYLDLWTAVAG